MDNLEEMDRFLEKFNLPRLNQEKIEIMNKTIINTEIETVIKKKNSPKQKPRARWLHQRRQWHSTPVLLPGKFHGQRSMVGCSPQGR